jgi:hypothetical protein
MWTLEIIAGWERADTEEMRRRGVSINIVV